MPSVPARDGSCSSQRILAGDAGLDLIQHCQYTFVIERID